MAAIRVTSAPRRAASAAKATPIRPEERLPTKRTGSIGSRVPPAVTSTRRPSSPEGARVSTAASMAAKTSAGSASRPTPRSPSEASRPVPGSTTRAPRARRVSRFAVVAGCSHMWLFIAGARTSGAVLARAALVSRLSAWPPASLASVFAEAGTTANTSQRRTSSKWEIGSWSTGGSPGKAPRAGSRSNSSARTGAPVTPSKVAAPTNRCDAGVCITRTECPAAVARRTTSTAL